MVCIAAIDATRGEWWARANDLPRPFSIIDSHPGKANATHDVTLAQINQRLGRKGHAKRQLILKFSLIYVAISLLLSPLPVTLSSCRTPPNLVRIELWTWHYK